MRKTDKFDIRKEELFSDITNYITEVGYENVTIRGICKKVGISTGTFYHYFNDKNDLVRVLFDDIDEYFKMTVPQSFTEDEGENLVLFFRSYGEYSHKNGVETCKCISAAPFKNTNESYMEDTRSITVTLSDIIKRGVEKGQFRKDINLKETTGLIMIMMRGFSADWAKKNGEYDIVSELEKGARLIVRGLQK